MVREKTWHDFRQYEEEAFRGSRLRRSCTVVVLFCKVFFWVSLLTLMLYRHTEVDYDHLLCIIYDHLLCTTNPIQKFTIFTQHLQCTTCIRKALNQCKPFTSCTSGVMRSAALLHVHMRFYTSGLFPSNVRCNVGCSAGEIHTWASSISEMFVCVCVCLLLQCTYFLMGHVHHWPLLSPLQQTLTQHHGDQRHDEHAQVRGKETHGVPGIVQLQSVRSANMIS